MFLNVKKRGNSRSIIVSKEMAMGMNVDDGDTLNLIGIKALKWNSDVGEGVAG